MNCCAVFRKWVWGVVVVFALTGPVQAYQVARVTTAGQISVYRDGQLVQVLRESAPLPKGAMLKAQGRCGVQLSNMYLLAEDNSQFSIYNEGDAFHMALDKGAIYFAVNQMVVEMLVQTPGVDQRRDIQMRPATVGILKGFVDVNEGLTTVGVIEGGTMVVSTPDGEQFITAGHQITLAQADILGGTSTPAKTPVKTDEDKKSNRKYLIIGALAALAIGGLALGGGGGGGGGDAPAPASPAAP
jgi:hypothetical protein